MHPIRTGAFRYRDYSLSYELVGSGGSPVLLIHGLLLDTCLNRDIALTLADAGHQVALLDLLGHGRSDAPAEATAYRIDDFAAQALAALDHLGWDRAVLGGISLGTITALHVAVREPNRVRALLLEMPVMEHAAPAAALMLTPLLLAARYAAPIYRPVARLIDRLPRPRNNALHSVINAAARDPAITSAILHGILVGPIVPPASERRRIQAPALVIGHKGDLLHPFDDAEALARDLPRATVLEARSILELRTRPNRLMPQILEFLAHANGSGQTGAAPAGAAPAGTPPADTAELEARFEAAVEQVRQAPADGPFKPDNELKLKMYALYRQATDGDCTGKRPGLTDPVGRFKHDAWKKLQGMSREAAMAAYVKTVDDIAAQWDDARRQPRRD